MMFHKFKTYILPILLLIGSIILLNVLVKNSTSVNDVMKYNHAVTELYKEESSQLKEVSTQNKKLRSKLESLNKKKGITTNNSGQLSSSNTFLSDSVVLTENQIYAKRLKELPETSGFPKTTTDELAKSKGWKSLSKALKELIKDPDKLKNSIYFGNADQVVLRTDVADVVLDAKNKVTNILVHGE